MNDRSGSSRHGERAREALALGAATHAQRLAIKRAVYKVVDSMVDGFLWRLQGGGFEPATRGQVLRKRFGRGQVVLERALVEAFPRYKALAGADVDKGVLRSRGDDVAARADRDTEVDSYRSINFEIADAGTADTGLTVESVVLIEALALYNEIVDRFDRGAADEVQELEELRESFKARYRDLVSVDTDDLVQLGDEVRSEPTVLERFWTFLKTPIA